MDTELLFTLLRWINLALSSWAALKLGEGRWANWKTTYHHPDRILWHGLMGTAVSLGLGSVNALYLGLPWGPQVFTSTITMVFVIWWAYLPQPARLATSLTKPDPLVTAPEDMASGHSPRLQVTHRFWAPWEGRRDRSGKAGNADRPIDGS